MRNTPVRAHALHPADLPPRALGGRGWRAPLVIVIGTLLAAAVGGVAAAPAPGFYESLVRPTWAPPAWLFGPAWAVLFTLMAIAAYLVWHARGWRGARGALTLYGVQLVLNALWTWCFFAWRQGGLALVEVIVLWLAIAATAIAFGRVRRVAAVLLLPYLAWVGFATALTLVVWRLNPGVL